ncbi:MAG: M15 family metallopeptidase [Armatimonadetes bacterium]|nr:M15 family metallopeptidase [Armatimonadota bacterium]
MRIAFVLLALLLPCLTAAQEVKRSPLVELVEIDPRIQLDIRYARSDNFLGFPVYRQARAFLQKEAAEALKCAHDHLRQQGYGLVVFDGYRPWSVTKLMWDRTPPEKRQYVADPAKGSRHNRGCAVDLSLVDLETGKPVAMPSEYDDFSEKAHPDYAGGTEESRKLRDLLRREMERQGFTVYPYEWWHFDYRGWERYPIRDTPFEQLDGR